VHTIFNTLSNVAKESEKAHMKTSGAAVISDRYRHPINFFSCISGFDLTLERRSD